MYASTLFTTKIRQNQSRLGYFFLCFNITLKSKTLQDQKINPSKKRAEKGD